MRAARDPATGKSVEVPENWDYGKWYEERVVKGNTKTYQSDDDWQETVYGKKSGKEKNDIFEEFFKNTTPKRDGEKVTKNIDVDDLQIMASSNNISEEVAEVIGNTISRCENEGGFYVSEVRFMDGIPSEGKGTPVFQTEPGAYGLYLNANTQVLAGKTVEEIDAIFERGSINAPNSLEEALIHEVGHARLINGLTITQIKDLYKWLDGYSVEGVSPAALVDGAEAIADIEVLQHRGADISEMALKLYKELMGGQHGNS